MDVNRRCDRFWYENGNQAGRFSEAQLAEIRKVALARVVCENSDTIGEITRSVFDLPHNFLNPRVPCRSLPPLDLTPWREQDSTCVVLGKSIALGASSLVSPCTSCTCTAEGVSTKISYTQSILRFVSFHYFRDIDPMLIFTIKCHFTLCLRLSLVHVR